MSKISVILRRRMMKMKKKIIKIKMNKMRKIINNKSRIHVSKFIFRVTNSQEKLIYAFPS
jgi:hypothetical protein